MENLMGWIKKKNYKLILVSLFICLLLFISYNQYQDKKMYEIYISKILTTDLTLLARDIVENDAIYDYILKTEEITKIQADYLAKSNDNIMLTIQEYAHVAVDFKRIKQGFEYNDTSANTQKIALFFNHWEDHRGVQAIKLDSELRNVITHFQMINSKWIDVIKNNGWFVVESDIVNYSSEISQPLSLTNDLWLDLLIGLEEETTNYLSENNLNNIEELWYQRNQ